MFLVTPDGVIVTDPINADAATWLKAEIAKRFNQPIRYVIYSHDHRDHIAGDEVFANDGAIVVAHERAKGIIMRERGLDEEAAYTMLRTRAMQRGVRLVAVAEMVVEAAEVMQL